MNIKQYVCLLVRYLSDRVALYLHHSGCDCVGTGLQAAVLSQETAHVHWVQEHLLTVRSWNQTTGEGEAMSNVVQNR